MGFGNVGGGEILVILLLALLVLGPAKLPEVARQAGRAMSELRKVTSGFQRELDNAMNDDEDARARGAAIAATRPPLVHDLTPRDADSESPPSSDAAAPSDATPGASGDVSGTES